jgi:hypothetical protein
MMPTIYPTTCTRSVSEESAAGRLYKDQQSNESKKKKRSIAFASVHRCCPNYQPRIDHPSVSLLARIRALAQPTPAITPAGRSPSTICKWPADRRPSAARHTHTLPYVLLSGCRRRAPVRMLPHRWFRSSPLPR